MIAAWVAAAASAAEPVPVVAEEGSPFSGAFDAPPAFHYRVRLPGGALNAATHAEWSSPVLAGSRIYIGAAAGRAMFALDRTDGTLLATYPAENAVESEAVIWGGDVFFSDSGGNTYRFTAEGELVWKHDGHAPILVSPTVTPDGSQVLVTNVDDLAVALDADTGELIWQYHAKRDPTRHAELTLYAAPKPVVVADPAGARAILGFSSGTVVGVDLESGEEQWKRSVGEGRYPDIVADLVDLGQDVLASGYFGPFVAIDAPTHNVRWRVEAGAAHAPLALADRIVHPGSDGALRAIAPLTGASLWRWESKGTGALTTPVLTEAGLVVASSEGGLWIVDPEEGETAWAWREPWLLASISTPPAVEGRQLVFVTGAGWLYSLVVPVPEPPPRRAWP